MVEFVRYCSYTLDIHPLYQNLKDIEISKEDLLYFISTIRSEQASEQKTNPKTNFNQANGYYVDSSRIDELKDIKQKNCDYTRLIQLLEELNLAWRNEMYMSVSMIVRAIIDHIPPVFEKRILVMYAEATEVEALRTVWFSLTSKVERLLILIYIHQCAPRKYYQQKSRLILQHP